MSTDSTSQVIIIPLTKDQITMVDQIDADLFFLKWCASRRMNYSVGVAFHAVHRFKLDNGTSKNIPIHRVILSRMLGRELTSADIVDHINGDPLDNRRSNLRLADTSQNRMNQGKRRDNKSGFKGVVFHPQSGKWRARIKARGIVYDLGLHDTPELASIAYGEGAKIHHGEFSKAT